MNGNGIWKRNGDLALHLLLFVAAHAAMFALLRMDEPPSFAEKPVDWIKAGKMWFYHKESGIFVSLVWLGALIVHGLGAFTGKSNARRGA